MADGGYTILHRKDERGVIVESGVFGPDDEIPEGFGTEGYTPIYAPREDDQAPVDEVNHTQWASPIAKGTRVEQTNEAVERAAEDVELAEEPEDVEPELDDGSPREAREQAEDGELTGAEEEVDESLESDDEVSVPPQGGPGSGRDVWAQYAAAKDVSVDEGASRDEIIAACKKANVPVD